MSALAGLEVATGEGALFRLDKAAGPTSHDVVHAVRRHLGVRRVGHAGTLDPQATGLLVVGVGRATRVLRFVAASDKVYRGELVLGTSTDTLDRAGKVVRTSDWPRDEAAIRSAGESFVGAGSQVPPMVSAVRVAGERLYRLAARGRTVERPGRPIVIRRLDIAAVDVAAGRAVFELTCSSGTYVRALAQDWGERLGCAAHLGALRRLRVGDISVAGAYPADRLAARGQHPAGQGARRGDPPPEGWRDLEPARVPWSVALAQLPVRRVTPAEEAAVAHGRGPRSEGEPGPLRLESEDGRLLAIAEASAPGTAFGLACVLVTPSETS